MTKKRLSRKVHEEITRLCQMGDELAEQGDRRTAYDNYSQTWDLVPEDKENWEASTWILAAVGELQFQGKTFEKALDSYLRAVQCPTGLGNPYIHMRIGQCQYEMGNMNGAGDNLTRAYMGADERIFQKEDPKYLRFLREVLHPSK